MLSRSPSTNSRGGGQAAIRAFPPFLRKCSVSTLRPDLSHAAHPRTSPSEAPFTHRWAPEQSHVVCSAVNCCLPSWIFLQFGAPLALLATGHVVQLFQGVAI